MVNNDEHQFESDIEAVMTGELGWVKATQLKVVEALALETDLSRTKFLARLG